MVMGIIIKTFTDRIVITLDVINSKKNTTFTSSVREKVATIEQGVFEFPLSVSRGDEIQGVLLPGADLGKVLRVIRYELLPFKLRIGVGLGQIEIPEDSRTSWDLSGDAFFYARDCVDELEKAKRTAISFSSKHEALNLPMNTILELMNVIISDWTKTQFMYVLLYEQYGTFEKVSDVLGVSSQNVHKACKRANWEVIKRAEENLEQLLKRWIGDDE